MISPPSTMANKPVAEKYKQIKTTGFKPVVLIIRFPLVKELKIEYNTLFTL